MIKRPDDEAKAMAKLPRWVQYKIQKLTADAAYWKEKITPMLRGESNVAIIDGMTLQFLPMDSRLVFVLEGEPCGHQSEVRVNFTNDRRSLEIRLDNMLVQPEANNTIRVIRGK